MVVLNQGVGAFFLDSYATAQRAHTRSEHDRGKIFLHSWERPGDPGYSPSMYKCLSNNHPFPNRADALNQQKESIEFEFCTVRIAPPVNAPSLIRESC